MVPQASRPRGYRGRLASRTRLPRLPLQRDDSTRLPPALRAELDAMGGLWWAGDAYTDSAEVVEQACAAGVRALRLDFKDLRWIDQLPDLEFVQLQSDGSPDPAPLAGLQGLRGLLLDTHGLKGEIDPLAFPELRWLSLSLGGRHGPAHLASLRRGHDRLEWLSVRESTARSAHELCAALPSLRVLRIRFADRLRSRGPLVESVPRLEKLATNLVPLASLDGLRGLGRLTTLDLFGGRVTDAGPLRDLRALTWLQLLQPSMTTIDPLRGHPAIRVLALAMAQEPGQDVLASMPGLEAVVHGKGFEQEAPVPDLRTLPDGHPLRNEWRAALDA